MDYRLLPNFFQVGGSHLTHPWDASSYLIRDTPSVLIDCGTPHGVEALKRNIRETGVTLEEIGYIIGTHGHYDHVSAVQQVKAECAAQFLLHSADANAVRNGDPDRTASRLMYGESFSPITVDRELGDYEEISLERALLRIVHTPGHTLGSVSLLVSWDDFTLLVAGDTVWGGYHEAVGSDLKAWKASMKRLLEYDIDALVWGHSGSLIFGDANTRLKEAESSLGVYFVPWRLPISGAGRYAGNPLAPGRMESFAVP